MMDYAAMLQGRPFQLPTFRNPYEGLFQNYLSMVDTFQRQAPQISQGGSLARHEGGANQPFAGGQMRDEFRRPDTPQPQMFGGY